MYCSEQNSLSVLLIKMASCWDRWPVLNSAGCIRPSFEPELVMSAPLRCPEQVELVSG